MTSSSTLRYQSSTHESIEGTKDQLYLQNAELNQKNQHLLEQIQTLQHQFEVACAATSELQEISNCKTNLEKEVNVLKGQNDDLSQRIEILVQANSELTQKLKQMETCTKRVQFSEISNLQKKLEEERIDSNHKISELQDNIQNLNDSNEKLKLANTKLNLSLTKIYEASSQKFSTQISDPETVVALLLTNYEKEKEETTNRPIDRISSMTQTCSNEKDKKKDFNNKQNIMKSKIKKMKNLVDTLRIEKESTIKEITKKYENQISDLNALIDQLKSEIEKRNERIEYISQEKKNLLQENGKLTAQVEFSTNQNLFQQQISKVKQVSVSNNNSLVSDSEPNIEVNQLRTANEKLKKQLSTSISKIKLLEDDRSRLKFQMKTQKQSILDMSTDIERLNNERQEMSQNIIELEKKLSITIQKHRSAAIAAQQQSEFLGQKTMDFEKIKIALTKDQNQFSQQLDEIQNLQEERKKIVSLLHRVSLLLNQYDRYEHEKNQKEELQKKFKLSTNSNFSNNSNYNSYDNLNDITNPVAAFTCTEFPEDLADLVNSLASKNNLRTIAKIKQILLVIAQYYNEQIIEIRNSMKDERERYLKTNDNFKNLTDFLINLFPQLDLDFENGFKKTLTTYIEDLQKIKNDYSKLKTSFQEFEQIHYLNQSMPPQYSQKVTLYNYKNNNNNNDNSEETVHENNNNNVLDENERKAKVDLLRILDCDTINEARKKVVEIQKKLGKYVIKFKKEKLKRKQISKEAMQHENNLREQLESAKMTLSEFEQSASSLEIQKEGERAALTTHIEKMNSENEKLKDEVSRLEALKTQFQSDMTEKYRRLQNIESQLINKSKDLKNACRAVELLQQQVRKKDLEVNELRSKIKLTMKQNSEKVKNEREMMQSRFDQIVEPLKLKNNEFQNAVNDLNDTIANLETDNMKLRKEIAEKTIENEKLAMLADSAKKEADHEKQLIESKSKAAISSLEVECRTKVDEYKWKIDQSKKDVMGLVGMQFCNLYDLNEKIDESNFENFLKGIRIMLEKLVAQDSRLRQLLCLGPSQSVEDAVSKLLLESNPIV